MPFTIRNIFVRGVVDLDCCFPWKHTFPFGDVWMCFLKGSIQRRSSGDPGEIRGPGVRDRWQFWAQFGWTEISLLNTSCSKPGEHGSPWAIVGEELWSTLTFWKPGFYIRVLLDNQSGQWHMYPAGSEVQCESAQSVICVNWKIMHTHAWLNTIMHDCV